MQLNQRLDYRNLNILLILKKYRRLIVFLTILFVGIFSVLSLTLPKKYKSIATIAISINYFQNNLVGDLIPNIQDSSLTRAERESFIKQSLDFKFIADLAQQYNEIKKPLNTREGLKELESFGERIETIGMSHTDYQIEFVYKDPEKAQEINNKVVNHIVKRLRERKIENLKAIQKSLLQKMELMILDSSTDLNVKYFSRQSSVEDQIEDLKERKKLLKIQYSDSHPEVQSLDRRIKALSFIVNKYKSGKFSRIPTAPPSLARNEVYADLQKKYNNITISISTESMNTEGAVYISQKATVPLDIIFPKKRVFLLWGLMSGLMCALLVIALLEISNIVMSLQIQTFSKNSEAIFLGELPVFQNEILKNRPIQKDEFANKFN